MENGVVYLLTNAGYGTMLTVSLHTLRKWYDGPVTILTTTAESQRRAQPIVADKRLQVQTRPMAVHRRSAWHTKCLIPKFTPYKKTVFLDADTLIVGKLDELWPVGDEWVFVQSGNSHTDGMGYALTLIRWAPVDPQEAAEMGRNRWPVLQSGVFGFAGNGEPWRTLWDETVDRHPYSNNDEPAMNFARRQCAAHRVLDDRFNVHAKWNRPPRKDARVWHGAAKSFFRKPWARELWFAALGDAISHNAGGLWDALHRGTLEPPIDAGLPRPRPRRMRSMRLSPPVFHPVPQRGPAFVQRQREATIAKS